MVYAVVTFDDKNDGNPLPASYYAGAGGTAEAALYRDITRVAAEREFTLPGRWQRADHCIGRSVIDRKRRACASGAACLNLKRGLRRRVDSPADSYSVGGRTAAVSRENAACAIGRGLEAPILGNHNHSNVSGTSAGS